MSIDGRVVSGDDRSQAFADFFEQKIWKIVENTKVDEGYTMGRKLLMPLTLCSCQDMILFAV